MQNRYWRRRDSRAVFATPMPPNGQVGRTNPHESPSLWQATVSGSRSPDEGDWVSWRRRRGPSPTVTTRVATLRKKPPGRWASCGQDCHQDDQREVDHRNGERQHSRENNLQALHGPCHEAKPREHKESLPVGRHAQPQHTEERRDRKRSCSVLQQR